MARKAAYYEVLAGLRELAAEKFGKKMIYSRGEVMVLLGICQSTLYKRNYPFVNGYITLEALAERLV